MKSMRDMIKLMESVMAVPGLTRKLREATDDDLLNAIAALYGPEIWDNNSMQDLANDLEMQNPSDAEIQYIITHGSLPPRLEGMTFNAGDGVQFDEDESDMQTAGTVGRNQDYAEFDAAQQPATESSGGGFDMIQYVKNQYAKYIAAGMNDRKAKSAIYHDLKMDEYSLNEINGIFNEAFPATTQESVPAVDSCQQTNPATADVACAMAEGTFTRPDSKLIQTIEDAIDRKEELVRSEGGDRFSSELDELLNARAQAVQRGTSFRNMLRQLSPLVRDEIEDAYNSIVEGVSDLIYDQQYSRFSQLMSSFVEPQEAFDVLSREMAEQGIEGEEHDAIMQRLESDFFPDDSAFDMMNGPDDFSDDADALASAGHGSDEDYGDFPMDEDLNNGYNSIKSMSGDDFFPDGADGPVTGAIGPNGARHGDNPEQKKMQVAESGASKFSVRLGNDLVKISQDRYFKKDTSLEIILTRMASMTKSQGILATKNFCRDPSVRQVLSKHYYELEDALEELGYQETFTELFLFDTSRPGKSTPTDMRAAGVLEQILNSPEFKQHLDDLGQMDRNVKILRTIIQLLKTEGYKSAAVFSTARANALDYDTEDLIDAALEDAGFTGGWRNNFLNYGASNASGLKESEKKMQVAEVHKELVYGYRDYLKETAISKKKS